MGQVEKEKQSQDGARTSPKKEAGGKRDGTNGPGKEWPEREEEKEGQAERKGCRGERRNSTEACRGCTGMRPRLRHWTPGVEVACDGNGVVGTEADLEQAPE